MAITHFTPQLIGRSSGRSALLSAAYRHCAKMTYEREARTVDFSNKRHLAHEEFLLPPGAPDWARALVADRSVAAAAEAFWNRVEAFEKREDAQFAKEFIIALPVELSKDENVALMRQFVFEQVLSRGQIADWVYHDDPGNPHVHLMTTLRPLTKDGFGAKKIAVIGEDGQPVRTKQGKIRYRLWAGEKEEFLQQRGRWLDLQNEHLALRGFELRVDGRSYAERGIDLVPTTHIGVGSKAIQRKAQTQGWQPSLERIDLHNASRKENAARIMQRPQIVVDLLSDEKSVFDERDIAKVLHRYIDDPVIFRNVMAAILDSTELLRIDRDAIDIATGEHIRARYTTRQLIRLEAAMAKRAMWLSEQDSQGVQAQDLQAVLARHHRLSSEQRTAIEHVTGGARIAAVVGRAGAGKTTMMKAACEAWEAAGYRVVGGALAGKAAEGLEKEAGIKSRTLASWQLRWREGRDTLDHRSVFVLDEAGMVASKQMAGFLEAVVRSGAKIVLVGDPEQLQPIEAGAPFRAIANRIGYAELETIYRQHEDWMRTASLALARGRVAEAVLAYEGKGRIIGESLKEGAVARLIADWNNDYDPEKTTLILAHLRRDVRKLNELARDKLVERRIVGKGHAFATGEGIRHFDIGDQIVFLKNDSGLGVKNGMIARVVEAAPGRIVAGIGKGNERRQVTIEQRHYTMVDHGYATTIHKSQGLTVDRVKVLASLSLDRHLAYVALTRHREDMALYYGTLSFAKAGGLVPLLSRRAGKETTLDYERHELYRQALRFADNRGLQIVRVARTLLRDHLEWTLRQTRKVAELARRLRSVGEKLGLAEISNTPARKEIRPMLAGIPFNPSALEETVEHRLLADPAVRKQWDDVSDRFRYVFADPETAFRAMDFHAVLTDDKVARQTLERFVAAPASIGRLAGKTGLFASSLDKQARRVAEANVPALKRSIEIYLGLRQAAQERIGKQEQAQRQRLSIDIPALSPAAHLVLERLGDAIDRNDLPAALGHAISNPAIKAEIDIFGKAVAERFGEQTLLMNAARHASGSLFDKAAEGLAPAEREKLVKAWPLMRTARQLAAHERTAQTLKMTESLRQAQQQQVLKQ
ncbi:Ti-type conjugative transfer relaxase TraA [Phyllobacterium sp. CCNWLW109]|uniref:Ti-type conjugative transfer relaxase TraA n=1 Tax=Phyllobacterium sp. CCNWLW109 TaxID=3127479 RepID=UPI003077FB38